MSTTTHPPKASASAEQDTRPLRGAVVHHVDPALRERFHEGAMVAPAIRAPMQEWHA